MGALFLKRLFVRFATVVWIMLEIGLVSSVFSMLMMRLLDYVISQPGGSEGWDPQTVVVMHVMAETSDIIIPLYILLAVTTLLGMIATMTMSQDISDTYSHHTYARTSAKIASSMGYDPTMAATRAILDRNLVGVVPQQMRQMRPPQGMPAQGMPAPGTLASAPVPPMQTASRATSAQPSQQRNGEAS